MANEPLEFHQIKKQAVTWVYDAGKYIKDQMMHSFSISTKANQDDLVTDVDENVEEFFKERLEETFPTHRLMGEEGSFEQVTNLSDTVWILDPIDGTVNFVHQENYFAISLGIFHNGEPMIGIVYDVMHDEMFCSLKDQGATLNGRPLHNLTETNLNESLLSFNAGWMMKERKLEELVKEARGIRSYGTAAIEMAYVACGRLDAYISLNLAPWDIAGGYAILQEVGGNATNYDGNKLTFLKKDTLIAANPWIYDEIIKVIKAN